MRHPTQLIYSSAIAHKLAAQRHVSATDLAVEIAELVTAFTLSQSADCVYPRLPKVVLQNTRVLTTSSGFIQFELKDPAIVGWLDFLIQPCSVAASAPCRDAINRVSTGNRVSTSISSTPEFHPKIFAIQHAHARCCSLLRLAHRAHLITLDQPDTDPRNWQLATPTSVPWLTPDLQLQTNHSTERQLINQLLMTLDELDELGEQVSLQTLPIPNQEPSSNPEQALRLATNLSQAFQAVHRDIQMMGSHGCAEPGDRRHAHLGLILATQRLLHLLLQNCLGIDAPSEL
ncbi:MAG: hypothetical protein HC866_18525 [Leptolyngbyaceae cyanobacterium RU_5_1]|nr:hypothetical protein [Leptolyngbyaceae cyanobacterium RU_5_1]